MPVRASFVPHEWVVVADEFRVGVERIEHERDGRARRRWRAQGRG